MRFLFLISVFISFFFPVIVYSEIIKDIKVQGNKRVSAESIKALGNIKFDKELNANDFNNILKSLYETNFFKNIEFSTEDNILNIEVIENPVIQSLIITGVKKKPFLKILYESTVLKEKSPYTEFLAKEDGDLLSTITKDYGFYFSNVQTQLIKNKNNTVDLVFDINLGKRANIKKISFLGDKIYKERKLRNIITSEEDRFWKFISNKKILNLERISLDERLLNNFYKNNGYYDAKIKALTSNFLDDGSFELNFNIDAGKKYYFNKITLNTPLNFDKNHFKNIENNFNKQKGTVYSFKVIQNLLDNIDKIALDNQYEFIDANVVEKINGNKIDLFIDFIETKKSYIERINIYGNSITVEKVIRDQFIVDEGDAFNEILFNKTINNIKGLNFFKNVDTKIIDGSSNDLKIIDITVEEKATGEISLGAGVGTSGGTATFGIKENNFLGKGTKLSTNLTVSEESIKGNFFIVKPNYKESEKDIIFNLESVETDRLKNFGYKNNMTSISVGTRYEQYDDIFFSPTFTTFYESIETSTKASAKLKKQEGDYFETKFKYSFQQDKTDSAYRPTKGFKNTFSQNIPLVSKKYTLVNSYEFNNYHPIFENETLKFDFIIKNATALGADEIKISERLFLSNRKLRGFEYGKVGPKDGLEFVGGNFASAATVSSTLPFFESFQNTDVSAFVDLGNVWGVDYSSNNNASSFIRSSTGLAFDWFTPIGPLNFSLSQALTKKDTDITETFRFNLGTSF